MKKQNSQQKMLQMQFAIKYQTHQRVQSQKQNLAIAIK